MSRITQLLENKVTAFFCVSFLTYIFPGVKLHFVISYLDTILLTLTTTRVKTRSPTLFIFPPSPSLVLHNVAGAPIQ